MESPKLKETGLPAVNRYITTHDEVGKSVYARDLPEPLDFWAIKTIEDQTAHFELGYTTDAFPVPLTDNKDLVAFKTTYKKKQEVGLVRHGGTILRYCDIQPRGISPMHRTVSLDYGILISGELDCVLDSGETRTVHPGDLIVQRGTNHQWKNNTDKWVRIVFLLSHATPVEANGVELREDIKTMHVPPSH